MLATVIRFAAENATISSGDHVAAQRRPATAGHREIGLAGAGRVVMGELVARRDVPPGGSTRCASSPTVIVST
jgi:hypothetical protein